MRRIVKRVSGPRKANPSANKFPRPSNRASTMPSASSSKPRAVVPFDVQALLSRTQMQALLRQAETDRSLGHDLRGTWGPLFAGHLVSGRWLNFEVVDVADDRNG